MNISTLNGEIPSEKFNYDDAVQTGGKMEKEYVVELEQNCWIAPWDGDPGRTIVKENAQKFSSYQKAMKALKAARKCRPFLHATIVPV